MRRLLHILVCVPLLLLAACDVHEFPEAPDFVKLHLRLNYDTEMTEWIHGHDGDEVVEHGYGNSYDNYQDHGTIRYIIRTYPVSGRARATSDYTQEFIFTKDAAEGYDHEVTLDLFPGNYNIMVWSDLVKDSKDKPLYNADNFAKITLEGEHVANTDYRDAFRGFEEVSLVSDIVDREPPILDIEMSRPLAKFEFITQDVVEFIRKESVRVAAKYSYDAPTMTDEELTRLVSVEDYKVVFYYVGFMPNTYSMYLDKPVDSVTGVMFESSLKKLSENEAAIGSDYLFVNGKDAEVTVQIGIYDKEGLQLSLTDPIEVPLKRSHHTILTGMYLMSEASGGVVINPDYVDEYNFIFK